MYIGVGRSPTPIVAFLQNLDRTSVRAFNLPLSQAQEWERQLGTDNNDLVEVHELREKLYAAFRKFLPHPDLLVIENLFFLITPALGDFCLP